MTPATFAFCPADGRDEQPIRGIAAGARDELLDMAQVEAGWFRSEWIDATSGPAVRAGDRLFLPAAATLVDGGRLALEFGFQAKGDLRSAPHPLRLYTVDAMNFAEVVPATGTVLVVFAGVEHLVDLGALWADGDVVDLFVSVGSAPAYAAVRVASGAVRSFQVGSADPALSVPSSIDLLCDGPNAQLSSRLRRITAYRNGFRPSWIP
jgi:hypothetical protein